MKKCAIIFEDKTVFDGNIFSMGADCVGEVVFNTSMTGYQEILTDPSYCGQLVVMTYPMIGNYGINDDDIESRKIFLDALIVREYVDTPSNWRSIKTLKNYLTDHHVLGVTNVDTRALTTYIRKSGAKRALITSQQPINKALQGIDLHSDMSGQNLAKQVSCEQSFSWKPATSHRYNVAVIDCGCKYSILNMLRKGGCNCDVYSLDTPASHILEKQYDGVLITNGPGDPQPVTNVIQLIQDLLEKIPVYGICLGHQLICLAKGIKTYKLKFGHHGANHPILNLETKKVEITSQNHGFSVKQDDIQHTGLRVTHINLNDQTVAGIASDDGMIGAVQFHPEAAPGPHDSRYFFDRFFNQMSLYKKKKP